LRENYPPKWVSFGWTSQGEFVGLFRDSNERFLMLSVNVSTGNYGFPRILRVDDDGQNVEDSTDAPLALALVVASAIRDFLVVENREAQFSAKSAKQLRCSTNRELSVIYCRGFAILGLTSRRTISSVEAMSSALHMRLPATSEGWKSRHLRNSC
jgi:hypothetical protein